MTRRVSILRRGPRTRRERIFARFLEARDDARRRFRRVRHEQRRRVDRARMQRLFLQLGLMAHVPVEPAGRNRRTRLRVRHPKQ